MRAGIHGSSTDGAYSVVLSGGYDEDEDRGDTFVYTGSHGSSSGGTNDLDGVSSPVHHRSLIYSDENLCSLPVGTRIRRRIRLLKIIIISLYR
jgi:hypothetical protein